MAHPPHRLVSVLVVAFCLSPFLLAAQSKTGPAADLRDGIDQFRAGQYEKEILLLHNVIMDPSADAQKPAAYLLIAKAYMATGSLVEAARNLEYFIATYPSSADLPEALYQKCRLLFMQEDFEGSLQAAQSFISQFPGSPFVPSAWFWAAESLYGLGRLDDAMAIYNKIVKDFPTSAKVEASQYKISLIQLGRREAELTRLLKWSHEDFLRAVEEYQNRERAYEQAIQTYQKRIAAASPEDAKKTIADLQAQLAAKTAEAGRTSAQPGAASVSGSDQLVRLQRLLAAQERALALKQAYLEWLQANGGTGK
ncbi:MAG TPA: tetratricopeptide repeat protein [Spirochaetia bacterium]